jgi:hypothetical protein
MSGDTTADKQAHELRGWQKLLHPRGRRYAGKPFDVSSRHSIRLADAPGAGPGDSAGDYLIVDYFYHAGEYWRARIPLDGVVAVFGQAFNFSQPKTRPGPEGPELVTDPQGVPKRRIPWLNHVQCRFAFAPDKPVELHPLEAEDTQPARERIHDLVYSIEAVGPIGVRFNLRDALAGNLIGAHRMLSTHEMVFERIVVENMHVIESPPLPLDPDQRRAAIRAAIDRSHRAGMSETYYLYRCCGTNNCTSTPLREIDRIARYGFRQRLGSWLYRLPLNPRLYLRMRGLDSDPAVRRLLREEFAHFIQDPQTQQRKRDYVRRVIARRRKQRSQEAQQ